MIKIRKDNAVNKLNEKIRDIAIKKALKTIEKEGKNVDDYSDEELEAIIQEEERVLKSSGKIGLLTAAATGTIITLLEGL
ncbi:hypothetical protein D6779_12120 [Candidatus Parcubacteria bacterium]|nr:MAG: hypothetical protein D6779_12120 [Candidatus Parcubacteria bacterium]